MGKPFPREFGEDIVRVFRGRPDGMTLVQIATYFGQIDEANEVVACSDVAHGVTPGAPRQISRRGASRPGR